MARFDVYEYGSKRVPYVLDVQANLLLDLNTCVVIPLVLEKDAKNEAISKLKPTITIEGKKYILMTTDIAALPRKSLDKPLINLEEKYRQDITAALDFLFQGF